jgi:hypothetical protein
MALNDFSRKRKEVGGTNRIQTSDLGSKPLTRMGASGDGKNTITARGVQTGGAGDGMKQGRSTTHFSQPTGGGADTLKRFRESAKTKPLDDPTLSNVQALERSRGAIPTGNLKAVSGKKKVSDLIGGTNRLVGTKPSNVTDLGEFKKGGKTLRELSGAKRKSVSPFSEQGINQLFGSAADLAKLFSSKEFQSRKAKGIQQAAGAKGRRVDAKAKTEKIKALSGILEDLSASGGDNEGLMASVQEQIQRLISGGDGDGMSGEIIGKLASQFEPDQVKTILGIMR